MQNVDAAGLGIGPDYPPRIMGVLNVSEESPYDPSVFADPAAAARFVEEELLAEGADVVDVGLESANKRFDVLSADQELDRLATALELLDRIDADRAGTAIGGDGAGSDTADVGPVFSIETRYHEVAEAALDGGFDVVNDVCGFADPELPAVCRDRDAAVVKMASPPDLERPGAVESVDEIYDALERGGLTEKTIVDPAFGGWSEAKTLADDREAFRRLREFRALDRPILVSINRKNFLREIAGRETEAALSVSLAATSMAVERGANVIRTHDVAETRDAALVGAAFARKQVRSSAVEELDVTTVDDARRHVAAVPGSSASDRDDPATDAAPPESVARAFSVSLSGRARERFHELVADAALAHVTSGPGTGEREQYLAGTAAALDRLADRLVTAGEELPGDAGAELADVAAAVRSDR